ncbi:MAG: hypothetical protein IPG09_16515 [Ignavibacteria bacterium]|nr:hypothetical protein [Ignavibacteria bacterium]
MNWIDLVTGTSIYLHNIFFPSDNTGYAVGGNGIIIKTTNRTENWTQINNGTFSSLFSVSFRDTNNGLVRTAGGIFKQQTEEKLDI